MKEQIAEVKAPLRQVDLVTSYKTAAAVQVKLLQNNDCIYKEQMKKAKVSR